MNYSAAIEETRDTWSALLGRKGALAAEDPPRIQVRSGHMLLDLRKPLGIFDPVVPPEAMHRTAEVAQGGPW